MNCNDIAFNRPVGATFRGNEEMEEKGKDSEGRGELTARTEGVEYSKGESLRAGGKGIE